MAYQHLEARLAHVLLQQRALGSDTVHDLTQQDLAEMVGASRESVTRLLAQMGRTGLVEVKRRKIRLLDEAGLRALTDDTAAETTGASG